MVGRLEILRSLFSRIVVPDQVHQEILRGGAAHIGLSTYAEANWIEHVQLSCPNDSLLTSFLDKGEAAVIQVARELQADRVLIDERKARKVARAVYGLSVVGTAGALVLAKRSGLLPGVYDILVEMQDRGYWLHEDIITAAARAAGEMEPDS